jgi:hypothetical protein
MIPLRLANPCVPRIPTKLLCDAGIRIDPQVSLPIPTAAKLAAIAAPVPPLEPPGFQRLISRPANGADQIDAVLYKRVEILTHEPVLQLHIGARVGKAEEFLRRLQIGADYALDKTGHALLQILQTAPRGTREHHERADVFATALNRLSHLAAKLFELLGCVLNDLLLAVGQVLRPLAKALAIDPAGAIDRISASFANPAAGGGGNLTPASNGIAGRPSTGLDCLRGLTCGIVLGVISHMHPLGK